MTIHVGMFILASKTRSGAYLNFSRTKRTSAEFRRASRRARWFGIERQFRRPRERTLTGAQVRRRAWMIQATGRRKVVAFGLFFDSLRQSGVAPYRGYQQWHEPG